MVKIPTVRDRVVLHQLNAFLKAVFPECIPANIANGSVRQITADIPSHSPTETFVYGGDIKNFYNAIPRDRLVAVLEKRVKVPAPNRLTDEAATSMRSVADRLSVDVQ